MPLTLILLGIAALVLASSLRLVPPRHFAVVTRFGRPTGKTRREGLGFFWFYPHVEGAVLIPLDRCTRQISFPQVFSRDSAQVRFEIDLAWTASPDDVIAFIDNGRAEGAGTSLDAVFKDRIRGWAATTDWRDMLTASTLVTAYCVAGLTTETVSPQTVAQLHCAAGTLRIPALGIVLNRLNVTSVLPSAALAEAAEEDAVRREKGRASERELADTIGYIRKVMTDLGCTRDQAVEFLQLERGKVSKSVLELAFRQIA
jgi:regulator of protease activity HflC (stomatin/prohibitin superfamily)